MGRRRTAVKRVALVALLLCAGCRSAMTTTIENRGAPVDLSYLCGDAMYETKLATGASVTWKPVANACSLDIKGPSTGRDLTLKNVCAASTCEVGISAMTGSPATLRGSGHIDVVGTVATVGP